MDYDTHQPYDRNKKARKAEPILYDDLTGKLTPEGVNELDFMAKILSRDDFEFYYKMVEPAAQRYLRKHMRLSPV
jgi:hypothetical protein